MRRVLPFLVPFLAIVAAGIGAKLIVGMQPTARDCTEFTDVTHALLDHETIECVRVTGTAHYTVVGKQPATSGLFGGKETQYLFPLMAPQDTEERAVRVLVGTTRAPERLVSYETMTIEGRLWRGTPERIPNAIEVLFGKQAGYYFVDGSIVLEPLRVTVDEEVWEAP